MKHHTKHSSLSSFGMHSSWKCRILMLGIALFLLMIADAILMGARYDAKPKQSEPIFLTVNGRQEVFIGTVGTPGGMPQTSSGIGDITGPVRAPSGVWTDQSQYSTETLYGVLTWGANRTNCVGAGGYWATTDNAEWWTQPFTGFFNDLYDLTDTFYGCMLAVGAGGWIQSKYYHQDSWTQLSSGTTENLYGVYFNRFVDFAADGFAVGANGTILFTGDHGGSWELRPSGTTETLKSIDFAIYWLGYAVGTNGTLLRTEYQVGTAWTQRSSGTTADLNDIAFANFYNGIIVGSGGTILRTTDSGSTWSSQTSPTSNNLNSVSMLDSLNAVVVGDNGTILRTSDGGATWVQETSGTTENLYSVSMHDAATGYTVGANNTILRTVADVLPNLTAIDLIGPPEADPGDDISGDIALLVSNTGLADITVSFSVNLRYISLSGQETNIDATTVNGLAAGQTVSVSFTSAVLPSTIPLGPGTLKVSLNEEDSVDESDTSDNSITTSILIDPSSVKYVYYADFQDGANGWSAIDYRAQGSYWNQAVYNDGVQDRGVMWCGTDDPLYATPPGYGDGWDQRLVKEFTLPSGTVMMDYTIQWDTEPGYDYLYLDISTDGGTSYTNLSTLDGSSGGFVSLQTDLSTYAGQTVTIRWRITSDGAWSDEDGLWNSDGACRLDWIQITGLPADDFETDNDGWVMVSDYQSPGEFRIVENPACAVLDSCTDQCFSWAAYDENTGVFPFAYDPTNPAQRIGIDIGIESPIIDIPGDATAFQLQCAVQTNLPQDNLVFYYWEIAAPAPEYGGSWIGPPSLSMGFPDRLGFTSYKQDVSSYMQSGATTIKIRFHVVDMVDVWGGLYGSGANHTESPMFDDIAIIAIGTAESGIDASQYPRPCSGAPPADTDGDAVDDIVDACPLENSSPFDSDGDGCVDDGAGGRHVEYWARPAFPITYYINDQGAPNVFDGSDFTAIQNAMNAWTGKAGLETAVIYGGQINQKDADAMDMINLITFDDPEFEFGPGTLGVGITTSFTEATEIDGVIYRPGQIYDSDIIMNRGKKFRTVSDGDPYGTYIEAVVTHEAGHLFGISHSAVKSSTMFFVLGAGLSSASLEIEDDLALMKAYGDDAYMAGASRLSGTVVDGYDGTTPVAGAAVFAISAANGDTLCNEFTLPEDGSYTFIGLPDGDYYLSIHPLNGSTAIGQLQPGYINELIGETAQTQFVPEYWNAGESKNDDPAVMDAVTVTAAGGEVIANFVTNVDETGPVVTHTVPDSNVTDASIGGSVLISLSEAVDNSTLQGNFRLTKAATGEFVAGNAAFLNDDSVIAFVPTGMEFETHYKLRIDTGLKDLYANGLAEPFVMYFTTEVMPDVALTSILPSKGVPGTIVSMNGAGFDSDPQNNIVDFNGVNAVVSSATPTQLVVTVPEGVTTGVVNVYNQVQAKMSNDLSFTVLSEEEIPKGFESGVTDLTVTPKALTILPDGSYAYMATDEGVKAVVVDPSLPDYLTTHSIFISGGLTDIDAAPAGHRVYAVSRITNKLYRINTTPGAIGILSEKDIGAEPRGVYIEPSGRRAFIPTYDGEIQMWDINEASPSFGSQIGRIVSPDPNIRGKLAADPAGDRLIALTGTGKLLMFDLGPDSLIASIRVGPDPRDVVVDPSGNRAYVCDENGLVSIVSLEDQVKLQDIKTGGTLRGITITPAGLFVHAVNRELNLIDAIDLREGASTFRSVAATIPLPVNPVDIELSPDGAYAYTISEAEERLVVTTVGLGPSLALSSRRSGPVGTGLVLTGMDYSTYSVSRVLIGEGSATPTWVSSNTLFVTVPADATSGPVRVIGTAPNGGSATSNALFFNVLGATQVDALRLAASLPSSPDPATIDGGAVMAASPLGSFVVVGDRAGGIHLMDTDPASKYYHTYIGSSVLGEEANDIVMTPDGGYAMIVLPVFKTVKILNVNPLSQEFMTVVATADFSALGGSAIANVVVRPDRGQLLVSDPGLAQVHVLNLTGEEGHDLTGEEGHDLTIDASIALASGDLNGIVREMAYHPSGRYAYLLVHDEDPATILIFNTDPGSAGYLSIVGSVALPGTVPQEMPIDIAFTPDGARALVLTTQAVATPNRSVVTLDSTDPAVPVVTAILSLGGTVPAAAEHIAMSPRGDRAVVNIQSGGLYNLELGREPDAITLIQQTGDPVQYQTVADIVYASDATKFYCVSESSDELLVYDFSTVQSIAIKSGDNQAGVINESLPQLLEVVVSGSGDGSTAGIPVTFKVTAGSGYFAETNTATQVVETNEEGVALVKLVLGPEIGAGAHVVTATSAGLAGSPLTFTLEGLDDPNTLPLTVTYLVPVDGSENVSVPTAIQATFSRSVDPMTVDETTFYIQGENDTVPVPSTIGFADENRKVSLSPRVVLAPNTTYSIEITTGITDANGGALTQAVTSLFITQGPPPIVLESISPVSGREGTMVVLSGTGFNVELDQNQVIFNDLSANIRSGGKDYLNVIVPYGALSGPVRAINTATEDTSNGLDFQVLVSLTKSSNEVVATIGTSSATRSVAISPDGARAYAVAPYHNVVIPIDYRYIKIYPPIPVGENPVAITINPEGRYAYVANYVEGTVSVIDVSRYSPDYNKVVDAMAVGVAPSDLAITPDGDRLIVVNAGSEDLSVVDTDMSSETHHSVIASIGTGTGSRTVSITPDGGLIYLGTDNGYLVLSASSYGVVASIGTGSATRSVSITPDGAFLILLTTEGVVNIFDIQPNSSTRDQVIATIGTSTGTRTVGISPDGGLLFLVQEEGDIILVVSFGAGTSMGVQEDEYNLPGSSFHYEFVDTLVAGEDPVCIAFDPIDPSKFIVTNAGDNTISVFGVFASLAGYITADCPQLGAPLGGVAVDAFELGTGDLVASMVSDENGYYFGNIREGDYTATLVVPLGYTIASEESLVTCVSGDTTTIDFGLQCELVVPDARKMSYWKHELGLVLKGKPAEVTAEELCEYLDQIEVHFNNNRMNPVVVYEPPASGECVDKLQVAKDLLNLDGDTDVIAQAKKELMAFLFNVASGKLTLNMIISEDGANVSKAITFVDNMIDTGNPVDAEAARKVAQDINKGKLVKAGIIPVDIPDIAYERRLFRFSLAQNYPNPFNPTTTIEYEVAHTVHVRLAVYDVAGRLVQVLVDEKRSAERYTAEWNGRDINDQPVASGVYFYRLQAGKRVMTKKMVLLK